MASAKTKIRHVFGDTFSCRAAPPDILVKLSVRVRVSTLSVSVSALSGVRVFQITIIKE